MIVLTCDIHTRSICITGLQIRVRLATEIILPQVGIKKKDLDGTTGKAENRKQDGNGNQNKNRRQNAKATWAETTQNSQLSSSQIEHGKTLDFNLVHK